MRRQRSSGSVRMSGTRADPRAWGLGPNRGKIGLLLDPLPAKGDAAPPGAAQRGLLRAQSEVALPSKDRVTTSRRQKAENIAAISGVGPMDRPLRASIVEDLRGAAHVEEEAPAAGIVPATSGAASLADFGPAPAGGAGMGSLDRVFNSVCTDIMNFNFKPYVRPVHWPIQAAPSLAAGAPARALRRR